MTLTETAGKWLPPHVVARASPAIDRLDAILHPRDDQALAQRMALTAFVIRIMGAAVIFVSQMVFAQLLGEFEFGIFVFVWAVAVILGDLSCFGFQIAVIRFLPGYRDTNAVAEILGLTQTARRVVLLAATLVALTGIAGVHLMGERIEAYYVAPLYLGFFALPMIALGAVLDCTARASNWPVLGLGPPFFVRPLLILIFMVAAIKGGMGATAQTAVLAALAATYAATIIQYIAVSIRFSRRYASQKPTVTLGQWFVVALPMFFIEGLYFLLTNSDVIVVGFFMPPDQVAVYFAAAKTMALVHFVYYAVKAGVAPRFASLFNQGDRQALTVFARQTVGWTLWPTLAVGSVVLACGPFLLSLFGPAFAAGHTLMAILFAGIVAKALVGPGEVLLSMAGEQKVCAFVYLCVLLANIGLSVSLIPAFGLTGAASATAAAMLIEALLLHAVVWRRLGIRMFVMLPGHAALQKEIG